MVLGVNSGEVCGDPQSPNYSEPKIEKKLNPGFAHWFNKHMNSLQTEFMKNNEDEFMKWAELEWKK